MKAALLALLLTGCGGQEFVREPHLQQVVVSVRWFDTEEQIRAACNNPNWGGCATVGRHDYPYSTTWLLKPRSFDDMDRVCRIGHEALHWFGATHE